MASKQASMVLFDSLRRLILSINLMRWLSVRGFPRGLFGSVILPSNARKWKNTLEFFVLMNNTEIPKYLTMPE